MESGPLSYLVLGSLLILSAFFSAIETALMASNNHRHFLKVKAEGGSRRAKAVLNILENYDTAIITLLIGNNIANVIVGVITTLIMEKWFGQAGGLAVAIVVLTIVIIVFTELIPKSIASIHSEKIVLNFVYIVYFFYYAFYPLSLLFRGLIWLLRKMFKNQEDDLIFTEDDFQNVVETIKEEGIIDSEEREIFQAAVEFNDTFAKDILTKRNEIIAIDVSKLSHEYFTEFVLKHEYSRFPVYKGSLDNIIGTIHVRSYLKEYYSDNETSILDVLMNPYYITSQMNLTEIFEGFKKHHTHMAIVQNARHKTVGMVTMKDVLEELVSDIDEAGTSPEEGGAF